MSDHHERPWLSDIEVGHWYGISRVSVWRWVRGGLLPQPRKLGPNTTRWSRKDLEAHDAALNEAG